MEEFLTDYVQMYAECNDIKLTKKKLQKVVENLIANEEIWQVLDDEISFELL